MPDRDPARNPRCDNSGGSQSPDTAMGSGLTPGPHHHAEPIDRVNVRSDTQSGMPDRHAEDDGPFRRVESVPRGGRVERVTVRRNTIGRCDACGMEVDNVGAAYSHARSTRHVVAIEYRAAYLLVPVSMDLDEGFDGGEPS